MNWKTWLPLILALVLGVATAKVGWNLVARGRGGDPAAARLVQVAVAARDLAAGQVLAPEDLTMAQVSAEQAPREAFKNAGPLAGRVAGGPLVKGQMLLEGLLAPAGSGGGIQAMVPAGKRAVAVEVNEVSGVGGLLVPGCRVDVVTTLHDAKSNEPVARTIVENVPVRAVGQRLAAPRGQKDEAIAPTKTVTLIVTPKQAEAIELASNSGRMRLVLRGSLDNGSAGSEGMTVADLLGGASRAGEAVVAALLAQPTPKPEERPATQPVQRPQEAPPPAAMHVIQLIKGGQVSTVSLPVRAGGGTAQARMDLEELPK